MLGDRVYCKYHYLEGHEFDNSEMELLHFLKIFYDESWEWSAQYEVDENYDEIVDDDTTAPSKCIVQVALSYLNILGTVFSFLFNDRLLKKRSG